MQGHQSISRDRQHGHLNLQGVTNNLRSEREAVPMYRTIQANK